MERNIRGFAPVLGLLMIVGAWGTAFAAPAPDPTGDLPPEALATAQAAQAALDEAARALAEAQSELAQTAQHALDEGQATAVATQGQLLAAAEGAVAEAQAALAGAQAGAEENLAIAPDQAMAAVALASALAQATAAQADQEVQAKLAEANAALAAAGHDIADLQTMALDEGCVRFGEVLMSGPYFFWTSCNMGPGSGLDADTLDGLSSEDILLSVEQEAAARAAADALLQADLLAEELARIAAIQAEAADRAAAVAAEAAARVTDVDDEEAARIAAVAAEEAARIAALDAEAALRAAVDAEEAAKRGAFDVAEEAARIAGDAAESAARQADIALEEAARVAGDDALEAVLADLDAALEGRAWAGVLARDGSLSGLDADTLDGLDSTAFLRSAGSSTGRVPKFSGGQLVNSVISEANGRIGINVASPGAPLVVAGNPDVQFGIDGLGIIGQVQIGRDQTTARNPMIATTGYPLNLTFGTFVFGGTAVERLRIQQNGNVGIGTTSPLGKLNVKGSAGELRVQADEAPFASTVLLGGLYSSTANGAQLRFADSVNSGVDIGQNGNHDFVVEAPRDTARVVVRQDTGNVGIGTTAPGEKLSVAGTVQSTSGGFKFPDGTLQTTAAAGGLGGSGSTGKLAKFTAGAAVGDSIVTESAGKLGVGSSNDVNSLVALSGSAQDSLATTGRADAQLALLNGALKTTVGQGYLFGMRIAPTYDVTSGYANWIAGLQVGAPTKTGSNVVHDSASIATSVPTAGNCNAALAIDMPNQWPSLCWGSYGVYQGGPAAQYNYLGANTGIGAPFPSEKLEVNGGLKLDNTAPGACAASNAGTMKYVAGASGVADTLQMCMKSAASTYAWKVVVTG